MKQEGKVMQDFDNEEGYLIGRIKIDGANTENISIKITKRLKKLNK